MNLNKFWFLNLPLCQNTQNCQLVSISTYSECHNTKQSYVAKSLSNCSYKYNDATCQVMISRQTVTLFRNIFLMSGKNKRANVLQINLLHRDMMRNSFTVTLFWNIF